MHGLCTTIKSIVGNVVTLFDNDVEDHLCMTLESSPGKYTRLLLSTGVGFESYRVTCVAGCLKLSPTPTTTFQVGDQIWYESCHADNIADTINCLEEEGTTDTEPEFKIEGMVLETNEDGDQCWVVDPSLKEKVTFQVGKQIITIDGNGCPSVADAPPGSYPTEGIYPYATVTIGANCLPTTVAEGTKPVCGSCGCCCGGKTDTEQVAAAGAV